MIRLAHRPSLSSGAWSVFDLETTGTDPLSARAVEIGIATFFAGHYHGSHAQRLNPGCPIPIEASAIHKITDADVMLSPSFRNAWPDLSARLGKPQALVGYNSTAFDLPVLRHELALSGHAYEPPPVIDVYAFVEWHHRQDRERKLAVTCPRYGIELLNAHSAAADARATGELLLALVEKDLCPDSIEEAAAVSEQYRRHCKAERERWGSWLYSRDDQRIRLGCGEHQGTPLAEVAPGFLERALNEAEDLPPPVRTMFQHEYEMRVRAAVVATSKNPTGAPGAR